MTEKREKHDRSGASPDVLAQALAEPMAPESLKTDSGRGFALTSIKAAFVIERLNDTFGLLGFGWRYATAPHRTEGDEILVEVALQWWMSLEGEGCSPVYWRREADLDSGLVVEGWYTHPTMTAVWSEPIFATGGSAASRTGSVPLTDAYRSATTNGITKAASRLGVGLAVFKGQEEASTPPPAKTKRKPRRRKQAAKKPPAMKGFANLKAMRAAVKAELAKLTVEDGEPDGRTVQTLAHKMSELGFEMQAARLVHGLIGEGGFTQRGVMAVSNLLMQGAFSKENIAFLNQTANST